jgi:putative inorganic carbon (HCO3(-)) transporter
MKRRSDLLVRTALAVLGTYAVLGGATGSGLLTPQYRMMTLAFIALVAAGWLLVRWRRGWTWHQTPLDIALLLWILAVGLSLLVNLDSWRRIAIGVGFALVYLGLWYIAQDAIANKGLKRQALIEALLIAGLVVLLFGAVQLLGSFKLVGFRLADIPRLASTLDNPNFLGAFLMLLIPLTIGYLLTVRSRAARILLGTYIALALALLFITQSRAAWIGTAVSLGMLVILLLAHHNMLSATRLKAWWRAQSLAIRTIVSGAGVLIVVAGIGMSLWLIHSLSMPGRTVDLRTYIYDAAFQMFQKKPLTGYGLFTFGRGLTKLASTPPYTPHNSAHNLPLNVAAELGLFGLLALLVTAVLVVWAMWRNWRTSGGSQRILLSGAIAASTGLAVDHLLDYPTTLTPVVAIVAILTLVLATAPLTPRPVMPIRGRIQTVLLAGVCAALLVVGFWNTGIYADYVSVLRDSAQGSDPLGVARRLQQVIDADPDMPIYSLYQGYFFGLAANGGDMTAAREGVTAYRRFCDLEPYYAPAWADLGALYWQLGQQKEAIGAMEKAAKLAPLAWNLQYVLGTYYEATGAMEDASRSYRDALNTYPDASLYAEWQQTGFRRGLARENAGYSIQARVVQLLNAGKANEARQLWEALPPGESGLASNRIISGILALDAGDRQAAVDQLALAEKATPDAPNDPWIHLGTAYLARFDGNKAGAQNELDAIQNSLLAGSGGIDDRISAIAYAQFWSVGLRQYFLPQVFAPPTDAVFMSLLEHAAP